MIKIVIIILKNNLIKVLTKNSQNQNKVSNKLRNNLKIKLNHINNKLNNLSNLNNNKNSLNNKQKRNLKNLIIKNLKRLKRLKKCKNKQIKSNHTKIFTKNLKLNLKVIILKNKVN